MIAMLNLYFDFCISYFEIEYIKCVPREWRGCLKTINSKKQEIKMAIADVKTDGSWIIVIGDSGKEIKRMGKNRKQVVGITGSFFVVLDGSWIIT